MLEALGEYTLYAHFHYSLRQILRSSIQIFGFWLFVETYWWWRISSCCAEAKEKNTSSQQIQQLHQNIHSKGEFNKLTIAHTRGITFIELADIIALEADGNYTNIYVAGGETVLVSKTLGFFDDLLSESSLFFRTHKQFIINLNCIKEYLSGDHNEVILKNSLITKLTRMRRETFFELLLAKREVRCFDRASLWIKLLMKHFQSEQPVFDPLKSELHRLLIAASRSDMVCC